MRTAALLSVSVLLLVVAPAPAAHVYFDQAEYLLPKDSVGLPITILASGGELVKGIEAFLHIQANGPMMTGGVLTAPGMIFAGGDPPVIIPDPSDPFRIIYISTGAADARIADGTLGILFVSTGGIAPGKYSLLLSVGDNKSYFTDPNGNPIETSLGSTVLNVVPEPAAIVQILSLIATVPAVLVYRRWKAAK